MAWFCTGLGAIAGALVVGRVIPALLGGPRLVYVVVGAGYAVLGAFMIGYAFVRTKQVDHALDADRPVPLNGRLAVVVSGVSLALAVVTIVLVLIRI